jgi:indole-3-glycerol phosphate synthase
LSNVLDKIVEYKILEIEQSKKENSWTELEDQLIQSPPVRSFVDQLRSADGMGVIAEVKKASPSAGIIREDFDPVEIAKIYEQNGASCISVLTDEHFFQGHLDFLKNIRKSVELPLLRKDFILDRYQILEARVAGADCVLLIAECLEPEQLADLYSYSSKLGMDTLIEIYEPENLQPVLDLSPELMGINNRNLKTFVTDLEHSIQLSKQVPETTLLVSESGIRNREDVLRLTDAGIKAILVGETLMKSENIGDKLRELLETEN